MGGVGGCSGRRVVLTRRSILQMFLPLVRTLVSMSICCEE